MSYIVWTDNHTEGWTRSDDLSSLDDVLHHITKETYGHPYVVTQTVDVKLVEGGATTTKYPFTINASDAWLSCSPACG